MTDIRFVAKTYIDAGWAVVPIVKGEKRAATSWQRKTYSPSDFGPEDGIAGKCGEPSGWRVDVDCDAVEAIEAARLLLPSTGLTHGRPSKPDSHYWFICEGIKTTQFTDIKDAAGLTNMLIEIRSTGGYTVLPPSIHPSGDVLAWTSERTPMKMSPEELYAAVRNVAIAALVARHWPGSGVRHAMVGHLTGFLLQGGIDKIMVAQIVKAAAIIAKDSDADDRVKFARNTIAKYENGENVTGGPKLADALGADVVARIRAWLKLKDLDALEGMNEKHFWVRLGKDDCIGREDTPSGVVFQRVKALYSEYANRKVQVGVDKNGDPVFKPIFTEWLESPTRRSYREVVFAPPPRTAHPEDYNLWKGYAIDPVEGDCSLILEHMHQVVCSGDDDHFKYLTKLIAFTLQNPGIPSGVALVMRGDQGTGKGTFMKVLARIIGPRHYAHLDSSRDLVNFNSLISGKVVVFADEAFFAGNKSELGTLKRVITEPTIRITRKGIDSTTEDSAMHLFMATNEEWAIQAGENERRFFAVKMSNAHRQDAKYFAALNKQIMGDGCAAFLYEMLRVPVTYEEVINVPKTKELRTQQNQSMPFEVRWWQECLWEGKMGMVDPFNSWVPVSVVYDAYEMWVKRHSNRFLDKLEFGRRMMRKFLSAEKPMARRINGHPERCVNVRPLVEARRVFDEEMGAPTDWPDASGVQQNVPF